MCVCMMKYHLTLKKKEILPFAITLMNLENIRLSEINQKQKKKYYITYLYHESKVVKFIKAESTRDWREGKLGRVLVKGYIVCYK